MAGERIDVVGQLLASGPLVGLKIEQALGNAIGSNQLVRYLAYCV